MEYGIQANHEHTTGPQGQKQTSPGQSEMAKSVRVALGLHLPSPQALLRAKQNKPCQQQTTTEPDEPTQNNPRRSTERHERQTDSRRDCGYLRRYRPSRQTLARPAVRSRSLSPQFTQLRFGHPVQRNSRIVFACPVSPGAATKLPCCLLNLAGIHNWAPSKSIRSGSTPRQAGLASRCGSLQGNRCPSNLPVICWSYCNTTKTPKSPIALRGLPICGNLSRTSANFPNCRCESVSTRDTARRRRS